MEQFISNQPIVFALIIVLALIDLVLKLISLWKSARRNQLTWFICLGIINSLGVLPLIYLYLHRKKNQE